MNLLPKKICKPLVLFVRREVKERKSYAHILFILFFTIYYGKKKKKKHLIKKIPSFPFLSAQ